MNTWNFYLGHAGTELEIAGQIARGLNDIHPRYAFLDCDGVLVQGVSGKDMIDYLHGNSLFDAEAYDSLMREFERYRSGEISQDEAVKILADHYSRGVRGRRVEEVEEATESAVSHVFLTPGAEDAMSRTRSAGIFRIILSASPIEIVYQVARKLHAVCFAASAPLAEGLYTGEEPGFYMNSSSKGEIVDMFEKPLLAVGDSLGDRVMLERAARSVAFRPRDGLKGLAEEMGWLLFEGENLAECMELAGL